MKLEYCQVRGGNFGDDLNPWLWSRLIPDLLDNDGKVGFYGIGTLLHRGLPKNQIKVIFGAGAGYRRPPRVDGTWRIYCLRGPLTARLLRADEKLAITDPAYLLATRVPETPAKTAPVSFMPHYSTARAADWRRICDRAGIAYIDPAGPVDAVIEAVGRSELLIAEALHGAVAADALRVPWIPVRLSHRLLDFKWLDWCRSLGRDYSPAELPPVLDTELPRRVAAERALKRSLSRLGLGKRQWRRLPVRRSRPEEIDEAARLLGRLPRDARPGLSPETLRRELIERLLEKLERLREDHRTGRLG
ncbi:MAG: polysaccharide pyruvyl transferase [Candidatus Aureabacteria bacterium]|nr:polysaccharide pyruvyl transferase [Candidatus Auribacterota bacterium]